ncbi:MAG: TIGR04282 family arsenosugar biosynthesis glycosyltransferase [Pseudomonadales bacterium]|nr:TIGR04282 family arsenosugar biosynthesis glycosyltransferase [Pseudomonadales bacterium]
MSFLQQKPLRIVIFAKAPIAGFAKTRLAPVLGDEGAAALAAQLLTRTVNEAISANIGSVELCVVSDHHQFQWGLLNLPADLIWSQQGEGDLGQKMSRAAQRVLKQETDKDQSVLIIGTDCPMLDADMLRLAAQKLSQADVCLGPVSDGGYALLGMNQFDASVFTDIPWSTDQVARLTRGKVAALNWTLQELPIMNDIDEPDDLQWLPEDMVFAPYKQSVASAASDTVKAL